MPAPKMIEDLLNLLAEKMTTGAQTRATRMVESPYGTIDQDIPLPMPPGGRMDPRLMEQPNVLDAMGKAAGGYRSLRDSLRGMELANDKIRAGKRR